MPRRSPDCYLKHLKSYASTTARILHVHFAEPTRLPWEERAALLRELGDRLHIIAGHMHHQSLILKHRKGADHNAR